MASYHEEDRPVLDTGLAPSDVPYRAGGRDQGSLAGRKTALLGTGTVGYLPGREGQGPKSFTRAGYVHEAPQETGFVPGSDELEYAPNFRPRPRDVPVHTQTTHFGSVTRFLDGHSEVHRERGSLVELMNHPSTDPDIREALRQEIAHRDAVHLHRYW